MTRVRQVRYWLALALLLILTSSAWAEVCKGSKVPKANLTVYDQTAMLTQEEQDTAVATHLPWGTPRCPKLLPQREYVVCYDVDDRVTLWAGYLLRAEDLVRATRLDAFRTDPRLSDEESAHCADYAGSGYDRGHIVPRDDMNRTPAVQANSFFLSNMTPQTPALNRGIWRWLEELVRTYVKQYQAVYILSGSVFQVPQRVPDGNVGIRTHLYKILVRQPDGGDPEIIALLLPNQRHGLPVPPGTMGVQGRHVTAAQADAYLKRHVVSVDRVETLTGLQLLPGLTREDLKRTVASELWPRN